jgi:hypothetical protein
MHLIFVPHYFSNVKKRTQYLVCTLRVHRPGMLLRIAPSSKGKLHRSSISVPLQYKGGNGDGGGWAVAAAADAGVLLGARTTASTMRGTRIY